MTKGKKMDITKQPLIILAVVVIIAVVAILALRGGGDMRDDVETQEEPTIPQAFTLSEQYFEEYSGVDVNIVKTNRACENAPEDRDDCTLWEGRVLKTPEQAEQSEHPEYFNVQVMEFASTAPERLKMRSSNELLYIYQFTNYNAVTITKEIREDTVNNRWDIAVYFPCGSNHWIKFLDEDYGTTRSLNLNTMLNYAYRTIDRC